MSRKNQTIVTGIFWILGIVGLAFAASKTLHFIDNTLPNSDKSSGYLYLFFTGIGAVLWAQVYLKHAVGGTRRGVSLVLAVGDLLAEIVLVYIDTQYVASTQGKIEMSASEFQTFLNATVMVVGFNLIGWFIYHLNDPQHRKDGMAQDLADEVEDATYRQLNTPAERQALVASLMPVTASSILADVSQAIHERAGIQIAVDPKVGFVRKAQAIPAATIPQPVEDQASQPAEPRQSEGGTPSPFQPE